MAFLRRDDPEPERRPAMPSESARPAREHEPGKVTLIAAGSLLAGTISGDTEVLVEGELEGNAQLTGTLTIGPGGMVRGNVKAKRVSVAGTIVGNIEATERVVLAASGRIEGDVSAPRVAISEGGFCQGRIVMGGDRAAEEAAAAAATSGTGVRSGSDATRAAGPAVAAAGEHRSAYE